MQKLIIDTDIHTFELKVNNLLKAGWKVVVGTNFANIAVSEKTNFFGDLIVKYACSVVIEKEDL